LSDNSLQTTNTLIPQVVTEYSRISAIKYYSVEMNTALPNLLLMKPGFPPFILIRKHTIIPSKRWSTFPKNIQIKFPVISFTLEEHSRTIRKLTLMLPRFDHVEISRSSFLNVQNTLSFL